MPWLTLCAHQKEELLERTCLFCDNPFRAPRGELNRGNGKFCSLSCSSKYRASQRPKLQPNSRCALCLVPIYRNQSRLRKSKSGLQFCSRDCKDKAQSLDVRLLRIPHYGTGKSSYRQRALAKLPIICNRCGFNRVPTILLVHHKDRNRENNELENLEVLCPNCHTEEHRNLV